MMEWYDFWLQFAGILSHIFLHDVCLEFSQELVICSIYSSLEGWYEGLSLKKLCMEITQLAIALVGLCFLWLCLTKDTIGASYLTQGPKGLPFIGNALSVPTSMPWKAFRDWSAIYGMITKCNRTDESNPDLFWDRWCHASENTNQKHPRLELCSSCCRSLREAIGDLLQSTSYTNA